MLFVVILAVALLVYYLKLKYYTLRGPIPGLAPHFLFGNLWQSGMLRDTSLPLALKEFKSRYGDIFQFWFGSRRWIILSNIKDVQHIFTHRQVYDQGDTVVQTVGVLFPNGLTVCKGAKYKRHAFFIHFLLRRGKIISNMGLIVDNVDKLLARWRRTNCTQYIHHDIVLQCRNLLLDIFGFLAFDYDLQTLNEDQGADNELTQALLDILDGFNVLLFWPTIVAHAYLKLNLRYRRAKVIIARHLHRIIEQELAESAESIAQRKRTCLIASLVASLQKDETLEAKKSEEEKTGLSEKEIMDNMLLFLEAGFETPATGVAWLIHFISKHPRVQQKIKAELMSNGGNTQELSLQRLDSLVYLDCVVNEVLRLAPPIDGVSRTLTADDCLPDSGTQLYKGDEVFIPLHTLAHDTRLWSIDPQLFCPERFLDEDKNRNPYAFIPFGGGHRQCVAQDLARFEMKVIAARLMQHVTFGDGGPEVNAGGHVTSLTVMPKHVGVTIEFD